MFSTHIFYSKQEVICADSYVELSCKAFSMDMGLIVLEAVLNHNLSIQLTSPSETSLQGCLRSNANGVNKGNMPDNSQTKSSVTPAEYITGHNIKSMIYHSSSDLGHY
ncbi:unnamed protein product [Schistosoma curassoni]|uniref:Ovule protein n=1 Tax=Schistosoma curassoni TaxID=6186 RepID=A0A183JKI5_9TREM|nr:unnamed protein product [Schistosoma curassoni]